MLAPSVELQLVTTPPPLMPRGRQGRTRRRCHLHNVRHAHGHDVDHAVADAVVVRVGVPRIGAVGNLLQAVHAVAIIVVVVLVGEPVAIEVIEGRLDGVNLAISVAVDGVIEVRTPLGLTRTFFARSIG